MRVMVTGASGFVGGPTCRALAAAGHEVVAAARRPVPGVETRRMGDLGAGTVWDLSGIDTIIHLAARAHVMDETEADPLEVFRRVNRDGAVRLAEEAAAQGVRRLVFVSTIKVNGEATKPGRPFRAEDVPAPMDPYGIAKAEAEGRLAEVAARTGLEVTVVRPSLVHGPGAKGNLATLMKVLRRRLPLPLDAIDNRRSLVGVTNLAHALAFLVDAPATGTFLIRDGEDISTPQLIRRLGAAMGVSPLLLPVPPSWLHLAGRLTGKTGAVERLLGSLTVDDSPLRALGWGPIQTLDDGLRAMASQAGF